MDMDMDMDMGLHAYEEREESITVYVYVQDGNTALILASLKGHTSIVEMLLIKRADINHKNKVRCRGGGHGPGPAYV